MPPSPSALAAATLLSRISGGPAALLGMNDRGAVEVCTGAWPSAGFLEAGWVLGPGPWSSLREGRSSEVEISGARYTLTPASELEEAGLRWTVIQPSARPLSMGRFAQHLVHALRNSLSSVKLAVQTLSRQAQLGERERKRLQIAGREIRRMERLLTSASEFVRTPSRSWEPVSVGDLLTAAAAELAEELEARQVEVSLPPPGGLGQVRADPARLRAALENLLMSAAQASPPGSTVRVEAGTDPGPPRLCIHDPGPALTEGERALFCAPLGGHVRSSGLELALAALVAQELGGSLEAANAPQGGVVVTLRLGRAGGDDGNTAAGR